MRDMCVAAGIPCVAMILGDSNMYGDNYKSYEDYFNRNHIESLAKSRNADDYADEEIPEHIRKA